MRQNYEEHFVFCTFDSHVHLHQGKLFPCQVHTPRPNTFRIAFVFSLIFSFYFSLNICYLVRFHDQLVFLLFQSGEDPVQCLFYILPCLPKHLETGARLTSQRVWIEWKFVSMQISGQYLFYMIPFVRSQSKRLHYNYKTPLCCFKFIIHC